MSKAVVLSLLFRIYSFYLHLHSPSLARLNYSKKVVSKINVSKVTISVPGRSENGGRNESALQRR